MRSDLKMDENAKQARVGAMSTGMIIGLCVGIPVLLIGLIFVPIAIALVLPAVQQSREAAVRTQSKNNLKQIGLAMHSYAFAFATFPPSAIVAVSAENSSGLNPDSFDSFEDFVVAADAKSAIPQEIDPHKIGTPQHGWMTSILPYIDRLDLYDRVDFNQPWTAPQNSATFKTEIPVYLHPGILRADSGSRRVEENGASHYAGNSQLLKPNSRCSFADIPDGSTNTIMVGEVNNGFHAWGSPDNVRDLANGLGKLPTQFGSCIEGVAQFLMCDGSVRLVTSQTSPEILKCLADPRDGLQLSEF